MIKFDFSKTEYEYFLDECPFSTEEKEVLRMRRSGDYSIRMMSIELNVSERTVKRRIESVYKKILKVV